MIAPIEAIYDALYLIEGVTRATASRTGDGTPGATDLELFSLAYFSSILQSCDVSDESWGYSFFATEDMEPFATELSIALQYLKSKGAILDAGLINSVCQSGSSLLREFETVSHFGFRQRYLDTALSTLRFFPLPALVHGIALEPTLRGATASRRLMDEGAIAVVSQYFDAASELRQGLSLSAVAEIMLRYFFVAGAEVAS